MGAGMITGTLAGDFSGFVGAVGIADAALGTFEKSVFKIEPELQKMADSFSGQKIISEATLAAEVFKQLGGQTAFTSSELARMSAYGKEASEKLTAMGLTVPKGIADIASQTGVAATETDGLLKSVGALAAGYLTLATARKAVDFVKQVAAEASALTDLATQTHISVEEVQILGQAMSEFGVEQDTLAKGLYTLSRRIAGGDESVARGLHLMGLSIEEVKGLQPSELFQKIENSLAGLSGGLRDTAAADLFGARLGASMARASEGINEAIANARNLNDVMSTETAKALDAADESVKRFDRNVHAMAATLLGPVAEGFNTMVDAGGKGAGVWEMVWASLKDGALSVSGFGTVTSNMARVLDEANERAIAAAGGQRNLAAATAATTEQVSAETQAFQFLAQVNKDAAKELTDSQVVGLKYLQEIGALTRENAAGIQVNAQQFDAYKKSLEDAKKAATELKKEAADAARVEAASLEQTSKLWSRFAEVKVQQGGTANDIAIAQTHRWVDDITASAVKARTDTTEFYDALAAVSKRTMDGVGVDWNVFRTKSIPALRETADNARATYNEMIRSGQFFREDIDKQLDRVHAAEDAARGWGRSVREGGEDAARGADRFGQSWGLQFEELRRGVITWRTSMSEASAAIDGDLQSNIRNVQTLTGEFITAAQAKAAFDAGGSLAFDDSTTKGAEALAYYMKQGLDAQQAAHAAALATVVNWGTGAHVGRDMAAAYVLAIQKMNATVKEQQDANTRASQSSTSAAQTLANVATSYDSGSSSRSNVSTAAAATLAQAFSGATLAQDLGNLPAGTSVTDTAAPAPPITINVNGTAEEVADKISAVLMTRFKLGRKFGAA